MIVKFDRGDKLDILDKTFIQGFPPIKGDKVTFIGSTFMQLGETETYLNHCIALGDCAPVKQCSDRKVIQRKKRFYWRGRI